MEMYAYIILIIGIIINYIIYNNIKLKFKITEISLESSKIQSNLMEDKINLLNELVELKKEHIELTKSNIELLNKQIEKES